MQLETAGWYADPRERYHGRFFNGVSWTDEVCTDTFERMADPLGVAPGVVVDAQASTVHGRLVEDEPHRLQVAQRSAVHDQAMIQRAVRRGQEAGLRAEGSDESKRVRLTRASWLAVPAVLLLVLAGWWATRAEQSTTAVTRVEMLAEANETGLAQTKALIPEQLAFAGRTSLRNADVRPGWTDVASQCFEGPTNVRVAESAIVADGVYRVGVCGKALTFTPVADAVTGTAGASHEPQRIVVGDAAGVTADGVIVSWQISDRRAADTDTFWDVTFWGSDNGWAQTVRVPVGYDAYGEPIAPVAVAQNDQGSALADA